MRIIIEGRFEIAQMGAAPAEATTVEVVERQDRSIANLGLTLAEGRALAGKGSINCDSLLGSHALEVRKLLNQINGRSSH